MHVTHHQAQEDLLSREVGNLPGGGAVNRAYHLDAQGSVAAVTDAAQSTVTRYQTDAWGNVLSGAIADEPAMYGGGLGYWYDPDLALYYVKARWLNPATGRWLSVDPVESELRYAYVGNQPTTKVDPSGRQSYETYPQTRARLEQLYQRHPGSRPPGEESERRWGHPQKTPIEKLPFEEKLKRAIQRSSPRFTPAVRKQVDALISPTNLSIMAATLALWAGAHLYGVGEAVDVILLVAGLATWGLSVFEGAGELIGFVATAQDARVDADFNQAGDHFAKAVTILGIATVQAVALRSSAKPIAEKAMKGKLDLRRVPHEEIGPTPPPGTMQTTEPVFEVGFIGETDPWGNIKIGMLQEPREMAITYHHEMVHRFFTPRFALLRRVRVQARMNGYERSALLQYNEEAAAEGYGRLRVDGLLKGADGERFLTAGFRFPVKEEYVTVSGLRAEGVFVGNIAIAGHKLGVWVTPRREGKHRDAVRSRSH